MSLRGASAKEISREALLEKLSHERELRNYARRATAAATLIQVSLQFYSFFFDWGKMTRLLLAVHVLFLYWE